MAWGARSAHGMCVGRAGGQKSRVRVWLERAGLSSPEPQNESARLLGALAGQSRAKATAALSSSDHGTSASTASDAIYRACQVRLEGSAWSIQNPATRFTGGPQPEHTHNHPQHTP